MFSRQVRYSVCVTILGQLEEPFIDLGLCSLLAPLPPPLLPWQSSKEFRRLPDGSIQPYCIRYGRNYSTFLLITLHNEKRAHLHVTSHTYKSTILFRKSISSLISSFFLFALAVFHLSVYVSKDLTNVIVAIFSKKN